MPTLFTAARRRPEIKNLIRQLPAILAGKVADQHGIARGFRLRCAFAFLSIIKEAYIVKSRGGTDAAGIKWRKLSEKYLAYTRPMGRNGQGSRQPPHAGGKAPGGKDGFMTDAQLQRWRSVFGMHLARLGAAGVLDAIQIPEAAAAMAWNDAKRSGVRTKLEVFGDREVEILRDRGIMFNSLSPGTIVESGVDASYSPPEGQVLKLDLPGEFLVGSNVDYFYYHQVKPGDRPVWPPDGNLPDVWLVEIAEVGASGLQNLMELFK